MHLTFLDILDKSLRLRDIHEFIHNAQQLGVAKMWIRVLLLHIVFVKQRRTAILYLLQLHIRIRYLAEHFEVPFPREISAISFENVLPNLNSPFVILIHHLPGVFELYICILVVYFRILYDLIIDS
jgi:hypothetical protein